MLDKRTAAVLNMLSEKVGYSFKVVKKQALVDSLPQKTKMDEETLTSTIAFLRDNEYLTVKYQDKTDICLALTIKAESYLSGENEAALKTKISKGQAWLLIAGVFLAAFLGAFIAVLVGRLI